MDIVGVITLGDGEQGPLTLPWLKPGDSSFAVARFTASLTATPEALRSRRPCGTFSSCGESEAWFIAFWQREKGSTVIEDASAFTQASDLAWNPQALFPCQCAYRSLLTPVGENGNLSRMKGDGVSFPWLKPGVFTPEI